MNYKDGASLERGGYRRAPSPVSVSTSVSASKSGKKSNLTPGTRNLGRAKDAKG